MPHTLRSIDLEDETIAELEMIVGFDDDLTGEATRVANRLHGLLTQIRKAGRRRLVTLIRPKAPRMAERLTEDIFTALDEQTVVASTPSIGRQSAQGRLAGTRQHVMARPETPTVLRCR